MRRRPICRSSTSGRSAETPTICRIYCKSACRVRPAGASFSAAPVQNTKAAASLRRTLASLPLMREVSKPKALTEGEKGVTICSLPQSASLRSAASSLIRGSLRHCRTPLPPSDEGGVKAKGFDGGRENPQSLLKNISFPKIDISCRCASARRPMYYNNQKRKQKRKRRPVMAWSEPAHFSYFFTVFL